MNILYVTTQDAMGSRFNGYSLHKSLRRLGHNSHMAVMRSELNESEIHELGNKELKRINFYLSYVERFFSFYSFLPITAMNLFLTPYYKKADIVHLQLIHAGQFYSLFCLPLMSRSRRLIWTMHDAWMTTGHCIQSLECERWLSGCGQCPDKTLPLPIRRDTTALTWKLKKWIMHRSDVCLVVPSWWMYNRVKRSPILSHLKCHIIPPGVDTTFFRPLDREKCRVRFGIPPEANVLAFRSTSGSFVFKGTEYIERALALIDPNPANPIYLLTFDNIGGLESLRNRYRFIELGFVKDQNTLVEALCAADLFLMPSIAETFGMMAVECMACGIPVIVFEGTSLPDVVHSPHAGISVPYKDYAGIARAINQLLKDRAMYRTLVENGLSIVQKEYTLDLYVKRHIDLYECLSQ